MYASLIRRSVENLIELNLCKLKYLIAAVNVLLREFFGQITSFGG